MSQIGRSRILRAVPGIDAHFAAPEDLILHKLRYYRMGESDKHLRDIAAMLQISPEAIDRPYVSREAERLGLTDLWTAVLRRVDDA